MPGVCSYEIEGIMTRNRYRSIVFFLHNEEGQKETSCPTPPTGQNLKNNYCSIIFLWLKFPFSSRSKRRLFFTGMGDKVLFLHSFHIILIPFKKKLVPRKELLNPLHPNINMHILHTIIHTFLIILTRRICLKIKSFVYHFLYPHGLNEIEHYSLM